jgi:SAM-dependent MidA family methyltransferase
VTLRKKIEDEIRKRAPIPFSRYMEMCLYDSEFGYYARDGEQFGKAGDFYTSSDVHAVFGRLLARQFEEMWRVLGSPAQIEILELGPGRGLFAQDVLDWSQKKFPEFSRALHYTLVERSPSLRKRLESRFRERIQSDKTTLSHETDNPARRTKQSMHLSKGGGASRSTDSETSNADGQNVTSGPTIQIREGHGFSRAENAISPARALAPEVPRIIFANEFFDALPLEVLSEKGALRINTQNGKFVEEWAPASDKELEFLDRYSVHPEGHARTEATLQALDSTSELTASLQKGFFVAIDYGYTREEQLAGRHLGTIMAYRQHSASPNPYEAPGEQDITAHVNFTALAAAAEQNGMLAHKLLTQSQFLMGIGESNQFADAFEDCRLPQERAKVALQLKHLVTPAGMGETFHVLVGSKGVDRELVLRLSGLSFGKTVVGR